MPKLLEDAIKYLRLIDFGGGRNTTITPALLNVNESPTGLKMSFDQKGTVRPGWGRVKRYAEAFGSSPVTGLGEYRKSDGRTWLMIGAGDKIYYDRPSLAWNWKEDGFNLGTYLNSQLDASTLEMIMRALTFNDPTTQTATAGGSNGSGVYGWAVKRTAPGPRRVTRVKWHVFNWSGSSRTLTLGVRQTLTGAWLGSSGISLPDGTHGWVETPLNATVLEGDYYLVAQFNSGASAGVNTATQATSLGATYMTSTADLSGGWSINASFYALVSETYDDMTPSFSDNKLNFAATRKVSITPNLKDMDEWRLSFKTTSLATQQTLLDLHGTTNNNLKVYVKTDGKVEVSYGTGAATDTVTSVSAVSLDMEYAVRVTRTSSLIRVYLNEVAWIDASVANTLVSSNPTYFGSSPNIDNGIVGSLWALDARINGTVAFSAALASDLSVVNTGAWISPVIDISSARDKSSGYASVTAEAGIVQVYSRSAPAAEGPWTDWVAAAPDGALLHAVDDFVQVKLALNAGAVVSSVTVRFDASPSAVLLKDGLTANSVYCFKTFKDTLIAANGHDPLQKWDGDTASTEVVAGSPPPFGLIEVHQNRLWGIKASTLPSRLRYTDLLNFESWPALNFIDVSPDDGDVPTALKTNGTYLMIHKGRRTAVLVGDQTENYAVTWLESETGAQGQFAVAHTDKYLSYVAQDGVRFTDLTTSINAIERLLPDWEKIDRRLLYKAAQIYWGHLLLTSLPGEGAVSGNTETWIYDALRNAWTLRPDWAFSCFTKFDEYGEEVLLAGDATTGQVYKLTPEPMNDNVPVEYEWKSKELNFGEPERYKVWSVVYLQVEGEVDERTLQVRFYVDGLLKGGPDLTIPAGLGEIHTIRLFPSQYNAIFGQRLALSVKGSNGIHLITVGYTLRTFALGVL